MVWNGGFIFLKRQRYSRLSSLSVIIIFHAHMYLDIGRRMLQKHASFFFYQGCWMSWWMWWDEDSGQHESIDCTLWETIQRTSSPRLDNMKVALEEEMAFEVLDDSWHTAIRRIHTSLISIRYGLLQFGLLHRLNLSKSKLAKMYPKVDPACYRCGQAPATLYCMFWKCPKSIQFWSLILLLHFHISVT